MCHSTGANNPSLKRYVGPDDGLLGVNANGNHWNQNTPDGRQVCVHAFIGKLADGSIATYQTLPWNHRGWHCGGDGNNSYISFEICEDGLTDGNYFNKVYQEAVELCAYLCKMYNLDPIKDGVLICHSEGNKHSKKPINIEKKFDNPFKQAEYAYSLTQIDDFEYQTEKLLMALQEPPVEFDGEFMKKIIKRIEVTANGNINFILINDKMRREMIIHGNGTGNEKNGYTSKTKAAEC